ncbi:MAG TPA: CAP domain-containing protein [Actinomycetota bacterium]|nr:CAP domain-containing protein [Actinomycetota bacterium]
MGVIAPLTALVIGLATPTGALQESSPGSSALAAVASACPGATAAAGDTQSTLESMYCGINVVRHSYGLRAVRGNGTLNRSSALKANAVRRCGFTHTPCGMAWSATFRRAGYLPARAIGENLAFGQGELGTPVSILRMWLNSSAHRANLLARRWRDLGIAFERGHMFGMDGVTLWVMQVGCR